MSGGPGAHTDVESGEQCPWEVGSASGRKGRTGGGGWVHPEGANSMAVSGLRGRKVLVGTGVQLFLA